MQMHPLLQHTNNDKVDADDLMQSAKRLLRLKPMNVTKQGKFTAVASSNRFDCRFTPTHRIAYSKPSLKLKPKFTSQKV